MFKLDYKSNSFNKFNSLSKCSILIDKHQNNLFIIQKFLNFKTKKHELKIEDINKIVIKIDKEVISSFTTKDSILIYTYKIVDKTNREFLLKKLKFSDNNLLSLRKDSETLSNHLSCPVYYYYDEKQNIKRESSELNKSFFYFMKKDKRLLIDSIKADKNIKIDESDDRIKFNLESLAYNSNSDLSSKANKLNIGIVIISFIVLTLIQLFLSKKIFIVSTILSLFLIPLVVYSLKSYLNGLKISITMEINKSQLIYNETLLDDYIFADENENISNITFKLNDIEEFFYLIQDGNYIFYFISDQKILKLTVKDELGYNLANNLFYAFKKYIS